MLVAVVQLVISGSDSRKGSFKFGTVYFLDGPVLRLDAEHGWHAYRAVLGLVR